MTKEMIILLVEIGAALAVTVIASLRRRSVAQRLAVDPGNKKLKRKRTLWMMLSVLGIWVFVVRLLTLIFGKAEAEPLTVEIWAERVDVYGYSLSKTVIVTWVIMAVLILLALLVRIFVIPRMDRVPKGIQNVLETAVDGIDSYAGSQAHGLGQNLSAYLFTLALLMIGCAAAELLGVRAPTADITMTFAMALVTFFLINFYGIKRKGLGGRFKSLAQPTPVVFVFRVISDIAIPVSMACRLFGNMLGGLVVMELLYYALGSAAVGIPSVLGLYFNVFHPLIQAFIFITLTLTFINEAAELEHE